MANDYSGTGAAGSNSFRLTADGGTVSGATSVAGNPDIVLVAGANITLTGTSPNQIKISSSGGGGGGGVTSVSTTLSGITVNDPTGAAEIVGTLGVTSGGTSFNTYATGDIIYASAANTLAKLSAGTNTHVLTLAGGVPTWAAPAGTYSWIVEGGNGQTDTVNSGDTLDIVGGTGITTALTGQGTATPTLTIDIDGAVIPSGTGVANQVTYWSGANTIAGDTGLTYTPTAGSRQLKITDTGVDDMLVVESTDPDALSAPDVKLYRNSASPATGDKIGLVKFTANDGGSEFLIGQIETSLSDAGPFRTGKIAFQVEANSQFTGTGFRELLSIDGGLGRGVTIGAFDSRDDVIFQSNYNGGSTIIYQKFRGGTNGLMDISGIANYGFNPTGGGATVPADGEILIGNTTATAGNPAVVTPQFTKNTLTAGTGISITNNPGEIIIAATGGGGGGVEVDNGANNRVLTATGTGATDNINGEANLTFDGSILAVTGKVTTTTTVEAGTNVTAGGSVSATTTVTAGGNIANSAGDIVCEAGNLQARAGFQSTIGGQQFNPNGGTPVPNGSDLSQVDFAGGVSQLAGDTYGLATDQSASIGMSSTFITTLPTTVSVDATNVNAVTGGGATGTSFTCPPFESFTIYAVSADAFFVFGNITVS